MNWSLPRRGAVLAVLSLALLAGCSSEPTQQADVQSGNVSNSGGKAPLPAPTGAPSDADGQPAARVAPLSRSLIYTGSVSVRVRDVPQAAARATGIADAAGGNVASDSRSLNGDLSEAQIVLRVPAEQFAPILEQLAHLGTEESRSVQTEDVTDTLVDLDARLATQRASVQRVRVLFSQARTIADIASIEGELTRREADLNSLEQRKEKLAGLVALSTITLTLRGEAAPAPAGEESPGGFLGGLKSGWSAFVGSAKVALTVVGWLLPWLLGIGVPLGLVIWWLRRRRRTAMAHPATDVPSSGSA